MIFFGICNELSYFGSDLDLYFLCIRIVVGFVIGNDVVGWFFGLMDVVGKDKVCIFFGRYIDEVL